MTRKEITDKLENIEMEVKQIREYLLLGELKAAAPEESPLMKNPDFNLGYTLEDLYREFGKQKKHYATRLKHAFLEHQVETMDSLMALSLNDLLNMDGIGSETLRLLIKNLNGLGIDYYPVVNPQK